MSFIQECVSLSRQHLLAGFLSEAELSCRTALARDPTHAEATHLLGMIALRADRPVEAADLFRRAVALDPGVALHHNSLGVLYYGCRRYADAHDAFREAVRLAPSDAVARNNLGNTLRALGRLDEACEAFRAALALHPQYAEAHANLGNVLREIGLTGEAEFCLRHALALSPGNLDALHALAVLMAGTGRWAQAGQHFAQVMAADTSRHEAAVGLARVFQAQGRVDDAVALLVGVQQRAPANLAVAMALRDLRATRLPADRLERLANREMNAALDAAVRKAVRPGDTVLEVGTAGGLGAMMAARAGAAHVVTVDPLDEGAQTVRETVALNGYADRVSVMTGAATALELGRDLPRPADLMIVDMAGPALFAPVDTMPDMMAIVRHARRNLLRPGARIIPAGATVWAQLVQDDAGHRGADAVCGFDMGLFERYRAPGPRQVDMARGGLTPLSDPFAAWRFDFNATQPETATRVLSVAATRSGTAHGVVLWFDLHMDDSATHSSGKPTPTNHWRQAAHFFERDLAVAAGQPVMIASGYDQSRIHFSI